MQEGNKFLYPSFSGIIRGAVNCLENKTITEKQFIQEIKITVEVLKEMRVLK